MTGQDVLGVDDGCHLFSSLVSIIQTWWLGTTILTHSDSEYATQADWVTETNTSLWIQRCAIAWNLSQHCFIFEHNTDANMLCRLFDNRKYMDIYLSIHQEYCYLGKQKISLYFSTSTCEHLWPSPSNLVNYTKCSHNPSKDAADWSLVADFKSLLNFNLFWLKIWFSQSSPFVDM